MLNWILRRTQLGVEMAAATDTGQVREINEDSWCALAPPEAPPGLGGVLAVADGMGGGPAGEVASGKATVQRWRWER